MKKILDNKLHVGKIIDAHGIRGEIYCMIFSGDVSWLNKVKKLGLKLKSKEYEFEINKIKAFKKGFIASLNGFADRNRAEEFKGAELWVDSDLFISNEGESLYLREVLNFKMQDEKLGFIGEVGEFSTNGVQDLLMVNSSKGNAEIPFVKEFIIRIDFENKCIYTSLPEGLLEINLKNEEPDDDQN